MNMMQQETGDQIDSGYGNSDYGTPTDDEEATIPLHNRIKEVPDFLDTDIRDEQTLSNTQQEDWLLPTEPLHGARPRQTGREHPAVIDNRLPMEATGGVDGRKPGQAPLLSPGRQILMEEEVITPPRGGGRPAPEPQGSPRGVRAVPNPFPKIFPEESLRDGGLERQKDIGSPVDMLVNTVARMQKDIATLREENRLLRMPAIPQVVQAPGGQRSRKRKCHGSTGQLVGNNIDRCSMRLCGRMAGTMIQQHCNCSLIWRETR